MARDFLAISDLANVGILTIYLPDRPISTGQGPVLFLGCWPVFLMIIGGRWLPEIAISVLSRLNNHRFHPEQDRVMTLREATILQNFPRSYSFVPDEEQIRFKSIGRLIGNAALVGFAHTIGHSINRHLESVKG